MKNLARILCWIGLALLLVAIVVLVSRGSHVPVIAVLISSVAFGSTLAALHFEQKHEFGWLAVVSNALIAFSFAFFALQMVLSSGISGLGQMAMVMLPVFVGCINMYAAWPRRVLSQV